jgi:hypothetical protein
MLARDIGKILKDSLTRKLEGKFVWSKLLQFLQRNNKYTFAQQNAAWRAHRPALENLVQTLLFKAGAG